MSTIKGLPFAVFYPPSFPSFSLYSLPTPATHLPSVPAASIGSQSCIVRHFFNPCRSSCLVPDSPSFAPSSLSSRSHADCAVQLSYTLSATRSCFWTRSTSDLRTIRLSFSFSLSLSHPYPPP
ncbi:hypothetical protein K469DRAFT_21051 [Zopfia rhizophila CBS 207.26]|uniref:Uncharacterized protein n=1 Tax=Zopfia rhizophila CBS 207.26 TaxID=1314779 RepID=A0A6A6EYU2_9PEZI|nr:hypothetical protein K469DRAFT_21051 [Zopfia rhizophila CBS 207.26]